MESVMSELKTGGTAVVSKFKWYCLNGHKTVLGLITSNLFYIEN